MHPLVNSSHSLVFKGVDDYFKIENISGSANCDLLSKVVYNELNISVVRSVVERCKSWINRKMSPLDLAPIHLAVIRGDEEVADVVLKAGGNANIKGHRGYTPLHLAAMKADKQMVEHLEGFGINRKLEDDQGGTYEDLLRLIFGEHSMKSFLDPSDCMGRLVRSPVDTIDARCVSPGVQVVSENVIAPQIAAIVFCIGS